MEYLGCKFKVFEHVYNPSDDSYLLADNLTVKKGDFVLEIGTGCGLLSNIAAMKGARVISLDISPHAINCAKYNSELNNLNDEIDLIIGDLFSPFKNTLKFDLIIFNPPYLPDDNKNDDIIVKAWSGGQTGNEIILKFLENLQHYMRLETLTQIIISSLSDTEKIYDKIKELSFNFKIIAEEKHFFEKIILLELKKSEFI